MKATRVDFLVVKPPEGAEELESDPPENAFDPAGEEEDDIPF